MNLIASTIFTVNIASSALAMSIYEHAPSTLLSEVQKAEALYAFETDADPYRPIIIDETPSELVQIYAALDERQPPMKIYTFGGNEDEELQLKPFIPTTFTPGSAEDIIISFIRQYEAGAEGYDAVWHGNRTPLPARPTEMTVCEVRDWQIAAARRQKSTAIGLYQIVGGTYRRLLDRVDLPCDTKFDQKTQDMMGLALLLDRGWLDFKADRLKVEDFAFELAGEWAAFPAPYGKNKGYSRYRGIAGNQHQIPLRDYMAFLTDLHQKIRDGALPEHKDEPSAPSPALPEIVFTSNENDRQQVKTAPVERVISFHRN